MNNAVAVHEDKNLIQSIAPQEKQMLQALNMADLYVRMQHLSQLESAQIVPLSQEEKRIAPCDRVRLLHFTTLNYDAKEDVTGKLSSVFNAVSAIDCSAVFIVHHDGSKTDIYMGTACTDHQLLTNAFETMQHAIEGNFPGCKTEQLFARHNEGLLDRLFNHQQMAVAAVSSMASVREGMSSNAYLQGIEKLLDGMRGQPFALVVLASSVAHETLAMMRNGYEILYTQLTPFYKTQQSVSESDTLSFSKTIGDTVTQSVSLTTGTTSSKTHSSGSSKTASASKENYTDKSKKAEVAITAATLVGMVGSSFLPGIGNFGPLVVSTFGGNLSKTYQTITEGKSNISDSTTTHEDESKTTGTSDSESSTDSQARSESTTDGDSHTKGNTLQYQYENKTIGNILKAIDAQLQRIQLCEGTGAYQSAAYIIAADNATARMAASIYRSLLTGYSPDQNISHINVWNDETHTHALSEYIKRMLHPVFSFSGNGMELPSITAATLSSSQEMPVYFAWPRKALPGLMVDTHAEFARDIIKKSAVDSISVKIGHILHMGQVEDCEVKISLKELSKHMFVSGTTGSGKSNFCYVLLNRLLENGIKFMIVEPAKGEYAKVFGGRPDVRVYGTNKNLGPVLGINPFAFPKGIHVLEHIEWLLGVFNASWPMYAAMPEFLKEAIETAYRECGWDLDEGICSYDLERFPTFQNLVEILPRILKKTEFSQEVQGNYIGALVTRIKSMANGLCGQIFCKSEVADSELFDANTIIDISRLGSSETKSLIMGILIIRLQEHRMTTSKGINLPLKHVTLLEEAHHLLKASGGAKSSEGANIQGMSIELITNAIAEMRTYGESFIIADQSPMVMDRAVIRNTNTKAIFKLPDEDDRLTVGRTVGLNEDQITEIARLDTGVAVVHQGNWISPVLCQVDAYPEEMHRPFVFEKPVVDRDRLKVVRGNALQVLVANRTKVKSETLETHQEDANLLLTSDNPMDLTLYNILKAYQVNGKVEYWDHFGAQCKLLHQFFGGEERIWDTLEDVESWHQKATTYLRGFATMDSLTEKTVLGLMLMHRAAENKQVHQFYYRWYAFSSKNAG